MATAHLRVPTMQVGLTMLCIWVAVVALVVAGWLLMQWWRSGRPRAPRQNFTRALRARFARSALQRRHGAPPGEGDQHGHH